MGEEEGEGEKEKEGERGGILCQRFLMILQRF